jgi:DNA-directed RNA polymerase specialized sigma24 family protein
VTIDDLVADTLSELALALPRLRQQAAVFRFAQTIARHVVTRQCRQRSRESKVFAGTPDMGRAAAASCADSFQIVIEELLTCLTPAELELLRCELNRAMDRSSISAWLGIAEGTCGNRWTALRKRVQEILDIQPRRHKRAQESTREHKRAQESSTEPTRMRALLESDSGSSFPGVPRSLRAPRPRAVEHARGTPEHRDNLFFIPGAAVLLRSAVGSTLDLRGARLDPKLEEQARRMRAFVDE